MAHKTMPCQIEAAKRYNKLHTQTLNVRLNNKTDADIISEMELHSSKSSYIKELIREDIKRKAARKRFLAFREETKRYAELLSKVSTMLS